MTDLLARIDTYLNVIEGLSKQVPGDAGEKIQIETRLLRALIAKATKNKGNRK
ncbi:hypothetical protein KM176_16595 [Pseudooceanicola sp. CBS1P-1]|uniref:Uncharacterized protein n=1 Tax=Pseudooceanicola albus TaxID=2692189 RepID=A0A6L7G8T3_9RHOB|nr:MULTISPECIES: hypothetical protein [Pseudooceanicola]MBT9385495.1 hypothetical protein [Pseudooceanicola endophyticus]MXN19093.1 hypothetical protein [Pseudooceanicola albus]